MMNISNKALETIRDNNVAKGRLMAAFNRCEATINRWISVNDVRLTTSKALQIISEETGLTESDILETELTSY
jgi:hypothetical protein